MQETVFLYKVMPHIVYTFSFILAISSGLFVYAGLTSQTERVQTRLRIKHSIQKNRQKLVESASRSNAEDWLQKADYPLGLNAFRYHLIYFSLFLFLVFYYVVFPFLTGTLELWPLIGIIVGFVLFLPSFPYSLFIYIMKRVIDYQQAQKNAEVFMLYDLLINEIDMMSVNRINTYNLIRNIKPYFDVISGSLTKLLTSWSNDEGPNIALDKFASDIGTKEAKTLVSVIKTLDEVDRKTALESLRGMNNMFVRSNIENYRRRRKITTDLLSIPIKTTHFIIILNFLLVIVTMVSYIMEHNR